MRRVDDLTYCFDDLNGYTLEFATLEACINACDAYSKSVKLSDECGILIYTKNNSLNLQIKDRKVKE